MLLRLFIEAWADIYRLRRSASAKESEWMLAPHPTEKLDEMLGRLTNGSYSRNEDWGAEIVITSFGDC